MGRTLKRAVVVGLNAYDVGTDEKAMGEDAKFVTNPKAWGEDEEPEGGDVHGINVDSNPPPNDPAGGFLPAPPRSGRGSGEDAWQAWANTRPELGVGPDARKDDIMAAAESAGLIGKK